MKEGNLDRREMDLEEDEEEEMEEVRRNGDKKRNGCLRGVKKSTSNRKRKAKEQDKGIKEQDKEGTKKGCNGGDGGYIGGRRRRRRGKKKCKERGAGEGEGGWRGKDKQGDVENGDSGGTSYYCDLLKWITNWRRQSGSVLTKGGRTGRGGWAEGGGG